MTMFTRRSLLAALSATALVACGPNIKGNQNHLIASGLDHDSIDAVAKSYRLATGGLPGSKIETFIMPSGEINLPALKAAVAQDYEADRMFVHAGWRLSHTEGQLFTLLSHA